AIMHADPPLISSLQPLTPPLLDRLVRKCVAKDPQDRWQSARDLASELRWIDSAGQTETGQAQAGAGTSQIASVGTPTRGAWPTWARVALLVAGTAAVATLSSVATWSFRPSASLPVARFSFALGERDQVTNGGRQVVAISPDGTHMAYVANGELYVRAL